MIVYNYDADLEVSDTCVRSSLLSRVELVFALPLKVVALALTVVNVMSAFVCLCVCLSVRDHIFETSPIFVMLTSL